MFHVDVRLAEIQERHRRDRVLHDRERDALRSALSYRHRFGQLLVRLGRRIGGEAITAPAWQG